jgi:hypothetical protein
LQIAASADDAQEQVSNGAVVLAGQYVTFAVATNAYDVGLRFAGVSGLAGVTIDAATLKIYPYSSRTDSFIGDWYAEDAEAPDTFTTDVHNITGRTRTTATCEGDGSDFGTWSGGIWVNFTGDGVNTIADIIQELATSYDPTAIVLVWIYTSGSGSRQARTWDYSNHTFAPKLDIDYTAATGYAHSQAIII